MSGNNENEYANSIILKLESLTSQYNEVLLKYQKAIANYTSYLQQNKNPEYSVIQGSAFWGTGQAGTQAAYNNIGSVDSCKALCSKTKGCNGATFNPRNNGSCLLRSGDGSTVPSQQSDSAIIPVSKEYLNNINYLNQQLSSINEQIINITSNEGSVIYDTEEINRTQKSMELKNNYAVLLQERQMIQEKLNKLQSLEEVNNDTGLVTNSNYLFYILLLTFAIAVVVILFKISTMSGNSTSATQNGGGLSKKVYFIIIAIIVFAFIVYYNN